MHVEEFASMAVGLHARLARAVMAICGDRSLAEECAQEALVRAWQRVEAGEELRSLEAWTMRVALNWCHSQRRRSGAESRALDRMVDGQSRHFAPEVSDQLSDEVRMAVLALPGRQREAVVLFYLLDLDVESIAATTGRSTGAVKNALFHGRAALSNRLSPDVAMTPEESP